ncbi:MAG: hypothetical protein JO223_12745 [Hyphomicrobiales bacterium]|nr:hypothetical protein [Hyphomicrobiales bacterium]
MDDGNGASLGGRILLALLTLYALAMIAPDLIRIVRPLGAFGLATNADGLIYDVRAQFGHDEDSPAWRAGLRPGDRLDLYGMRCSPIDTNLCATNLALWGGYTYVAPGREGTLLLEPTPDSPARQVTLIAQQRPPSIAVDLVLLLTQVAGILVVLGAAYLVWLRPGAMTWGFFAYAMSFNPGQSFQFYAWLQQWPQAMLTQAIMSCLLQAAGYTGLLLFALRVPVDRTEGRWRLIERALPAIFIILLLVSFASLGSVFGYPTEWAMQGSVLAGFFVSVAALAILIGRRKDLSPRDYQRIRWVIWGCLIGLPAYLIAELTQETSLPNSLFGVAISEDVSGLFYLINGILCLFVVEAVRRPTVVSVWIPLRRATALGLLLSVPAYFIHEEMSAINELTQLPEWAWVLVASVFVFAISRAHEFATELVDRLFDRNFHRAKQHLRAVGLTIQRADGLAEIERMLVEEPMHVLGLASAAVFREENGDFRRRAGAAWEATNADTLSSAGRLLAGKLHGGAFALDGIGGIDPSDPRFPNDLARPVLGVPVSNPRRCFAVALYGSHVIGTDLDSNERELLTKLARDAEIAYASVDRETLQKRIELLEGQLAHASAQR